MNLVSAVIGIGIGLLVPACGYFGAKQQNKDLTCCFCGCNFLGACCAVFSVVSVFVGLTALKALLNKCDSQDLKECDFLDNNAACDSKFPNGYTRQQCYNYFEDQEGTLQSVLVLSLFLRLPSCILQCLGFYWGNNLYNAQKALVMMPGVAATTAFVTPQPQGAYPQATQPAGMGYPQPAGMVAQPAGMVATPASGAYPQAPQVAGMVATPAPGASPSQALTPGAYQ